MGPDVPQTPQERSLSKTYLNGRKTQENLRFLCNKLRVPKVLYRTFDNKSNGVNTTRHGCTPIIVSADPDAYLNLTADEIGVHNPQIVQAVNQHISRERHFRFGASGSPFISTTTSLTWVLSKMLKEMDDAKLVVMDGVTVHRDVACLHTRQFRNYIAQHWHYYGCYEYLVYPEIPEDAFIGTWISSKEILKLAQTNHHVGSLLNLQELLAARGTSNFYREEDNRVPADRATGIGVGIFLSLIRNFNGDDIETSPLSCLIDNIMYCFANEDAWLGWRNSEDFKDGLVSGISRGPEEVARVRLSIQLEAKRSTEQYATLSDCLGTSIAKNTFEPDAEYHGRLARSVTIITEKPPQGMKTFVLVDSSRYLTTDHNAGVDRMTAAGLRLEADNLDEQVVVVIDDDDGGDVLDLPADAINVDDDEDNHLESSRSASFEHGFGLGTVDDPFVLVDNLSRCRQPTADDSEHVQTPQALEDPDDMDTMSTISGDGTGEFESLYATTGCGYQSDDTMTIATLDGDTIEENEALSSFKGNGYCGWKIEHVDLVPADEDWIWT